MKVIYQVHTELVLVDFRFQMPMGLIPTPSKVCQIWYVVIQMNQLFAKHKLLRCLINQAHKDAENQIRFYRIYINMYVGIVKFAKFQMQRCLTNCQFTKLMKVNNSIFKEQNLKPPIFREQKFIKKIFINEHLQVQAAGCCEHLSEVPSSYLCPAHTNHTTNRNNNINYVLYFQVERKFNNK